MEYGKPDEKIISGCSTFALLFSSSPSLDSPSPLMYQPRSFTGVLGFALGGIETGKYLGCQPNFSKSVFGTSNSIRAVLDCRLLNTSSGKSLGVATLLKSAAGAFGGPQCVVTKKKAAPSVDA